MSWALIIAELMKIFGPLLGELMKKLLDNLFKKVAKSLDDSDGESKAQASYRMLSVSLEKTPRVRVIRRLLLEKMIDNLDDAFAGEMTKEAKQQIKGLAKVAD